jgi:hypothetical protein
MFHTTGFKDVPIFCLSVRLSGCNKARELKGGLLKYTLEVFIKICFHVPVILKFECNSNIHSVCTSKYMQFCAHLERNSPNIYGNNKKSEKRFVPKTFAHNS